MIVRLTWSFALLLGTSFTTLLSIPIAAAQSTAPPGTPEAVQETLPLPSETPLPEISPQPLPEPPLQLPAPELPRSTPDLSIRFPVERIEVRGSTVLEAEIAALVAEYEQQGELAFEQLLELRSRLTQLYISRGYVTSGAFLPNNQLLTDGTIQIQVVEGKLERIDLCLLSPGASPTRSVAETPPTATETLRDTVPGALRDRNPSATTEPVPEVAPEAAVERSPEPSQTSNCGSAHLQESYVRSRLARAATTPVRQQAIEEALQLLQLNPLIQQVNAELIAGSAPGQNILQVQVREAPAFRLGAGADNYQSPSIGSEQFSIQASHENLFGLGDRLSAGYGATQGLNSFDVGYAIPLNAQDGTLSLSYGTDESLIIEEQFEDLDIRSESQTFSIGFRQPLIRTPESEFALGIQADLRRSTSFLEGEPFSFSLGPENGESNVTVIRFSQDWVNRDARMVLAARSQFSFGINAFDATVNETGTDGRFFAWLGQFQWVQRLAPRWVLVSRVNAQLTPDSLLSLERFGYGGVDTVRGYQQNQLVTDNGVLGAVEVRFAPLSDLNQLQIIPFVEAGYGWNNQFPDPDPGAIASVGLGARYAITPNLSIRVDYGLPLVDVENEGNSLQNDGFYFSIRYQPF